jgi:hypothetical protein
MLFEIWKSDKQFIINLLKRTHLRGMISSIQEAETSSECDEFVVFELSKLDAEELVGQLSFEANHNKNKSTAARACDIADSIEIQLRRY